MARRALLVGINDYHGISDLHGCVNDVANTEIRVATDSRATKAGIQLRLDWLVKGTKAGDFLVFHYSGHGSQIRDRDKLEDGMDELICPPGFGWNGNTSRCAQPARLPRRYAK